MYEQLEMFQDCEPTLSLSDSLARICRLLENGQVWPALEAVCSLKQSGLLGKSNLNVLSLKTSKGFLQVTEELTLSDVCEKLPTLGYMTANGNLLIADGFYPKTESGFTLSDILEENPNPKYFLSEAAVKRLMSYRSKKLTPLRPVMRNQEIVDRSLLRINGIEKM